ncbi:MAG: dihydrodipicolinate synthase family protein [Azospirillaceae bacterium]|nr:dihydrodipicolinate synthase family protein [Azospirillaceae bacterium]
MANSLLCETTRGVFIISPTPFDDGGAVDRESLDSLVDFYLEAGVNGITVLGILGEAQKLSAVERQDVMTQVIRRVAGRAQVVVGASAPGTDNLVSFGRQAMDRGAAGLMIAPVSGLKTDDQIYGYWARVLEQLGPDVPVCYQDFPQSTNVVTSVAVLNRLIDNFGNLVMLKHEECPGLTKITALRQGTENGDHRRVSILVGNGGLYLPQELRRGADGAMTGFGYPEMLVQVCQKFFAGKVEQAEDLFDTYLPVLRHEQQPGFGLAIRKEILRRRGAIRTATLRHPGPMLTACDHRELDSLLARLNVRLGH